MEHDWTDELSSTIGGSYLGNEEKDFFEDLTYIDGYKALVNLFYKPERFDRNLILGCEAEYAERTNMDESRNDTTRISAIAYYNF